MLGRRLRRGKSLIQESINVRWKVPLKCCNRKLVYSLPHKWNYQFLPAVVRTFLRGRARTSVVAARRPPLELLTADEIHTLAPAERVGTHACPVIFPYILRLEPVVVYLQRHTKDKWMSENSFTLNLEAIKFVENENGKMLEETPTHFSWERENFNVGENFLFIFSRLFSLMKQLVVHV